jgi:thiamine transport system substrate-binding protein
MEKHLILLVLAVLVVPLALSAQGSQEKAETPTLTVYAYDSFVSEWGPGPLVIPEFEEQTGISVNLVSAGNGGELLSRVELEKHNPRADVVIGIPHELLHETLQSQLFVPYKPQAMQDIPEFLHFDPTHTLVPFNYGNFAFVYDSQQVQHPPQSLDDLLDPKWNRSIILMDPRTSSVGMGLLEWTIAVYGDRYLEWWEDVKPNVLTIADGWSSGYGLFTQGEAPLVISYTTSPVYHLLYEESDRFKSIVFPAGNMAVIEGAGIVASSPHQEEARKFIEYLLTDAQRDIAVANIMYPVNQTTELPEVFQAIPHVQKNLTLDADRINSEREQWLREWVEVMSR